MANEEHLKILMKGVEVWNGWREKNPDVVPDLSEADLQGVNLQQANLSKAILIEANLHEAKLSEAKLIKADFRQASLSYANLSEADLSGANLFGANLIKANLYGSDLIKADLSDANLNGANLSEADLSTADLSQANLSDANLNGAILGWADLTGADFSRANISDAELTGANLIKADLSDADLRGTSGYRLNESFIRGTRFSSGTKDPWSVLRRVYTGPRFFILLMLLLIFFIPLIAKTTFWVGISRTEEVLRDVSSALDSLSKPLSALEQQEIKEAVDAALEKLDRYVPGQKAGWKKYRVAQLVIGWDRGLWNLILTLLLIAYNGLRGYLTIRVSTLRDEEERSGCSPAVDEYSGLYKGDRVARIMLVIAVFSFCWNAWYWLSQEVWLPVW